MKIALKTKIQNGALVEVMLEKGWNQAQLARACGVSPSDVGRWLQMRKIPKQPGVCARIEAATGRLYEDLFPPDLLEYMQADLPREVTVLREVDASNLLSSAQRRAITSPEILAMEDDRARIVREVLATLSPKEERILRWRWGLDGEAPKTREEIGTLVGISRERIAQIEIAAMRHLREAPHRRHKLGEVWDMAAFEDAEQRRQALHEAIQRDLAVRQGEGSGMPERPGETQGQSQGEEHAEDQQAGEGAVGFRHSVS